MDRKYVLAIDQSTQGTKAILFDENGNLKTRYDLPHRQIVNDRGWVSHDLEEIYRNTVQAVSSVIEKAGIMKKEIACIGISNQRETSCAFEKGTGRPLALAVVWQCERAKGIAERVRKNAISKLYSPEELIFQRTGLQLSPYFPAAKYAWLLENEEEVKKAAREGTLLFGTVDSYLLYRLTEGKSFLTDYSNASRTELFDIHALKWDPEICSWFGIQAEWLAEVRDSSSKFGETTMEGLFEEPVPITGLIGDSQSALFAQGCVQPGMVKATYGTGSSVMMNIGETCSLSKNGLVTSLAWGIDGKVDYVLEGNVNYSGAVITWLKDDMKMIDSPAETQSLAESANPEDSTCLVPAFTGLGAPYWRTDVRAMLYGMSRTTGRNEIVKAALESIAHQIADVVDAMRNDADLPVMELCADGGATGNRYLMRFQADVLNALVSLSRCEESSAQGAAFLAGIETGFYEKEQLFSGIIRDAYEPVMSEGERMRKRNAWKSAVKHLLADVQ